jgi:hypothetical protein
LSFWNVTRIVTDSTKLSDSWKIEGGGLISAVEVGARSVATLRVKFPALF